MLRAVITALFLLALFLAGPGIVPAADWTVKTVPKADGPGVRCVLESGRQSLSDGYQKTSAYISVAPRSVAVVSAAALDGSLKDLGLAVDAESFIPMDKLGGDKTALFDSKYDRVVEQFKAGTQVRVQLRFWPTWPATGTHSTEFTLIGFTKAYVPESKQADFARQLGDLAAHLTTTAAPAGRSGSPPTAAPAPAAGPERLSAEVLAKATARLAAYIGPLAKVMVKKAAEQAASPRDLYQRLAQHIDDPRSRERFVATTPDGTKA